jgi:hypothetical protein
MCGRRLRASLSTVGFWPFWHVDTQSTLRESRIVDADTEPSERV